jgi:hypothetical protein
MSKIPDTITTIRIPAHAAKRLEDWRRKQRVIPPRAKAMIELMLQALDNQTTHTTRKNVK